MLKVKIESMMISGLNFSPFVIDTENVQKVLMIGDNGAGKSLLLKMMSLNNYRSLREICIDNREITSDSISYISRLEFSEKYTAYQISNIMVLKYPQWDIQYYNHLLNLFEVDKRTPIRQLSLGKRQRIEIAVGLAKKPKLLLIDEAFEGIDDISRIKIMECIDSYLIKNDACLILTTHSTFGLGENFDFIIHMHKGKVVLEKDIEDFKQEVKHTVDYPADQSLDTLLSIYKDAWVLGKGDRHD